MHTLFATCLHLSFEQPIEIVVTLEVCLKLTQLIKHQFVSCNEHEISDDLISA